MSLRSLGPPLFLARLQDLRSGRDGVFGALLQPDFVTALSHELRSPLQAILSWAQLLRSAPSAHPAGERGLEAIERNVRLQVEVIEDMLEMSEILSGELRLDRMPIRLSPFVEEAAQQFAPDAAFRRIRLTRRLEADEQKILGDPRCLRSIVCSLVSHSLKHTPEAGSVDIDLRRAASKMQITVRDVSPEASSEGREHDPFRYGGPSSTRRFDGLGVGLMKIQRLVEMHGGDVWAESEGAGRGARFVITLPIANGS